MQSTFYRPDETRGVHDFHVKSTLNEDTAFAERVLDEKALLVPWVPVRDEARSVLQGLWLHTGGRHFLLFPAWVLELIVLIWVVWVLIYEAVEYCPIDMGSVPYCRHCYSFNMLIWGFIWVSAWFVNLYVYLLLKSRGFSWKIRDIKQTAAKNRKKGIPGIAVYFWFVSTIVTFVWLGLGVWLIIKSNQCGAGVIQGMAVRGKGERSTAVFSTLMISLLGFPVLFFFGRMIGGKNLNKHYDEDFEAAAHKYAHRADVLLHKAEREAIEHFHKWGHSAEEAYDRWAAKNPVSRGQHVEAKGTFMKAYKRAQDAFHKAEHYYDEFQKTGYEPPLAREAEQAAVEYFEKSGHSRGEQAYHMWADNHPDQRAKHFETKNIFLTAYDRAASAYERSRRAAYTEKPMRF